MMYSTPEHDKSIISQNNIIITLKRRLYSIVSGNYNITIHATNISNPYTQVFTI